MSEKYSSKDNKNEENYKEDLLKVGFDVEEKNRAGSYLQVNHSVSVEKSNIEDVEILNTVDALKKYDWLKDYWWKAVSPDKDEYTKEAEINQNYGYFIRVKPGAKVEFPVQSCLFISKEGTHQNVHNIIIVEEGAEVHIITGCSALHGVNNAFHIGVSEMYVKKGAKLTFTMIHLWGPEIFVRPRTGVIVEEDGIYVSNYVCMNPVKDLQMSPVTYCGKNATALYQTVLYASEDSKMDVGSVIYLNGENSKTEVISRTVARDNSEVIVRGNIIGKNKGIKGHLECRGLMLSDNSIIHAIPELRAETADADLSHEAAVGKISEEEIEYLMSRGLDKEEAASVIVRGFLNVDIKDLPRQLEEEIQKKIDLSAAGI